MDEDFILPDMAAPVDVPIADPAAEGLKSGTHRYTYDQKRTLERNNNAMAWLQTNGVPEHIRQREIARLSAENSAIQPIPVTADQAPRSPREQVQGQAWVDRDGELSHPGTTWVKSGSGEWSPAKHAPNNNFQYIDSGYQQQPASVAMDPQEKILAQQFSMGQEPTGVPNRGSERAQAMRIRKAAADQKLGFDRDRFSTEQKYKREERDWKRQESKAKREERSAEAHKKGVQEEYHRLLEAHQKSMSSMNTPPDHDKLMAQAEANWNRFERIPVRRAYNEYLRQAHIGIPDKDLTDEEGKLELARRKDPSVMLNPPATWEPGETPFPKVMAPVLAKLPPERVEKFIQHAATGRLATPEELKKAHPDWNYKHYTQLYNWARQPGAELPPSAIAPPSGPAPGAVQSGGDPNQGYPERGKAIISRTQHANEPGRNARMGISPTGPIVVHSTDQASFDRLPKDTVFYDENGRRWRKP